MDVIARPPLRQVRYAREVRPLFRYSIVGLTAWHDDLLRPGHERRDALAAGWCAMCAKFHVHCVPVDLTSQLAVFISEGCEGHQSGFWLSPWPITAPEWRNNKLALRSISRMKSPERFGLILDLPSSIWGMRGGHN